jgi:hypothetical protein
MNRTIDVRTEMRKLTASKPVHAAAGVGVAASETLRGLTAWLAKWRNENSVSSLPSRAGGYVTSARTRASSEYDKLAKRGQKALNGRTAGQDKGALNGKQSHQSHSRSSKA